MVVNDKCAEKGQNSYNYICAIFSEFILRLQYI